MVTGRFRDQLIAAPLKHGQQVKTEALARRFRDQLIAAPLKLLEKKGYSNEPIRFRDQLIAAPLKQRRVSVAGGDADRGPIEASRSLVRPAFSEIVSAIN